MMKIMKVRIQHNVISIYYKFSEMMFHLINLEKITWVPFIVLPLDGFLGSPTLR